MQKVIIKNLGPIKECEIEIGALTVFIGESASGKSVILRTISMLKWIYKRMQYKNLFKSSKVKSDSLRFRLDTLLNFSMLGDFFDKDNTYIELIQDGKTLVVISENKLRPYYENLDKNTFSLAKMVFLNENRTTLPEILSTPGGRRLKLSSYTNEAADSFYEGLRAMGNKLDLATMDVSVSGKRAVGYEQLYLSRDGKNIKLENSSSGEKNSTITEVICTYYAQKYDFTDTLAKNLMDILGRNIELKDVEKLQKYLAETKKANIMSILIEEPEMNLFPTNQKKMTEFLVSLCRMKNKPELILSTHSPYVLMTINNILIAAHVAKKSKENARKAYEIIPPKAAFEGEPRAYVVRNQTVESIIDENGLIDADAVDEASDYIAGETDKLIELL